PVAPLMSWPRPTGSRGPLSSCVLIIVVNSLPPEKTHQAQQREDLSLCPPAGTSSPACTYRDREAGSYRRTPRPIADVTGSCHRQWEVARAGCTENGGAE